MVFIHQKNFIVLIFSSSGPYMKSDIEIARETQLQNIFAIAEKAGLSNDEITPRGDFKAKVSINALHRMKSHADGKLILVTTMNPTPEGEGKTTRWGSTVARR